MFKEYDKAVMRYCAERVVLLQTYDLEQFAYNARGNDVDAWGRRRCRFGRDCRRRGDAAHAATFHHPPVICPRFEKCTDFSLMHLEDYVHMSRIADNDLARYFFLRGRYDPRRALQAVEDLLAGGDGATSVTDDDDAGEKDEEDEDYEDSDDYSDEDYEDNDYDDDDGDYENGDDDDDCDYENGDDGWRQPRRRRRRRRGRSTVAIPHYWSRGGHQEGYHQLEVKQWFLNRLQDLLDSCVTPNMGTARDQRCPGAYRRLVLTNVWRIEDNARWRRYVHARAQVRDRDDGELAAMSTPHDLAEYCELLPHKGEVLVFHGTLWESKRSLAMEGFDESLSSPNGLFGCGCYFSDSPSKADQYCTPSDEGVFYMFLCRVAMGRNADLGIAAPRHGATSAPEGFTSVTGRAHERAHREYVVYQGDLVYPEFLLAYYRD